VGYNPSTFDTSVQGYIYNAAGSMVYAQQDSQPGSARIMDGMQRPVYISDNYLIYSTVFGKVLTETNNTGAKRKTYVHDLGGKVIAIQQINYSGTQQFAQVRWEHADPSGASYLQTFSDGSRVRGG
jgi:hypothetical protein